MHKWRLQYLVCVCVFVCVHVQSQTQMTDSMMQPVELLAWRDGVMDGWMDGWMIDGVCVTTILLQHVTFYLDIPVTLARYVHTRHSLCFVQKLLYRSFSYNYNYTNVAKFWFIKHNTNYSWRVGATIYIHNNCTHVCGAYRVSLMGDIKFPVLTPASPAAKFSVTIDDWIQFLITLQFPIHFLVGHPQPPIVMTVSLLKLQQEWETHFSESLHIHTCTYMCIYIQWWRMYVCVQCTVVYSKN